MAAKYQERIVFALKAATNRRLAPVVGDDKVTALDAGAVLTPTA